MAMARLIRFSLPKPARKETSEIPRDKEEGY
jgi:hypothetical protein